jgi:hypothetical protein
LPLYAGQALLLRSLYPIRPRVGADKSARGTDHERAKGGNRDRVTESVRIYHGFVVAQLASQGKRSHAVLPHVGERHRRATVAVVGHGVVAGQHRDKFKYGGVPRTTCEGVPAGCSTRKLAVPPLFQAFSAAFAGPRCRLTVWRDRARPRGRASLRSLKSGCARFLQNWRLSPAGAFDFLGTSVSHGPSGAQMGMGFSAP